MKSKHYDLLVSLLTSKISHLEDEISKMKQAEIDRVSLLKRGAVREPGHYQVKTEKGWTDAAWNGSSWYFKDITKRGGVIEVGDLKAP